MINRLINGELLSIYMRDVLMPTLKTGDIVVLDNLAGHKGEAAHKATRDAGAHFLFLPPYSPDLNPTEQLFAKLKHLIQKAQRRSVETTWREVGTMLYLFSSTECSNYLTNSDYASV